VRIDYGQYVMTDGETGSGSYPEGKEIGTRVNEEWECETCACLCG